MNMTVPPAHEPPHAAHPPTGRNGWAIALILAMAVIVVHGWSLTDGLSLDDHWHYHRLRTGDRGLAALWSATTIDVDDLADLWFKDKPARFKYARPLAVALMRWVYQIGGWHPIAIHAFSIVLHWLAACGVWRLTRYVVADRWAALWASLYFVCFPLSMFAVSWPAAQNMVLMTVFMLAAVLAYLRADGSRGWGAPRVDADPPSPGPRRRGWLLCAYGLWIAALLSRENAVVLPLILIALDVTAGGPHRAWTHRRRYGWWLATAAVYTIWRVGIYADAMPDGYVRHFGYDGFALWCVAKQIFYWACLICPAPMVIGPSGRFHPFSEAPGDYLTMLAIVLIAVGIYALAARRRRGFWIWPLWVALATLPVTTVMATPHSAYLCTVGIAVGSAVVVERVRQVDKQRWRRVLSACLIVVLVAAAGISRINRLMWRGMSYAERFVFDPLAMDPPSDDADVFLINLPFAATYARVWLADDVGRRILPARFHVLTYAPDVVRPQPQCVVERVGRSRLRVRVGGRGWFSGFLGQFLIDGMRAGGPFKPGDTVHAPGFDVTVMAADRDGVHELEFAFAKPLDDPGYAFYLSSDACGALRLRFDRDHPAHPGPLRPLDASARQLETAMQAVRRGDPRAADVLFGGALSADTTCRASAELMLTETVAVVADATGAPIAPRLHTDTMTPGDINAVRSWWYASGVDNDLLTALFSARSRWDDIRERRDELKRARALIGRYVHSDLYLTGAPFPSPR